MDYIESNVNVMLGKLVVKGTRLLLIVPTPAG